MGLIHSITSWVLRKRILQIELFMRHPSETQQEVLDNLLNSAARTSWGNRFGYRDIQTIEQFQNRVPIHTYEALFPEIEKMLKGEKDVLWPGEVKWFSKSSGTTNDKSKFIPVTRESLNECHFKCGKDMGAIYLHNRPGSRLFDGKSLSVGGSHEVSRYNEVALYGDLSAVLIENLPAFFELFRTPDKRIALMPEWEEKLEQMARQVIHEKVTSISGVPTWTYLLIRKMLELKQAAHLNEIWPDLEVFFHGGVSFLPYRKQFEALIPSEGMTYFETYNASEGFFGLQNETDKNDLLLMLDYGIFYEFVPVGELSREHPIALTLDQVEEGKTYALVISTNGGLWRYLLGDTVTITNRDPFKIRISGRTKHFLNAFGEEVVMDNAEKAIAEACQLTGSEVENYTVSPLFREGGSGGFHQWIVEFIKPAADIHSFAEALDRKLRSLNGDYDAKRYRDMVLGAPQVIVVPSGTFYAWLKSRGKLGGQNKVPRLSDSREYADAILRMAGSGTL